MPKSILIVDDDPKNVQLLKDVLDVTGYQTIVAVNGQEAVDLTKSERPDLILMDIQMPVMNGILATKAIKSDPALGQIPIYAVTASVMTSQTQDVYDAGVDDIIAKPVDIVALLNRIKVELGPPA